MNLPISMDDSKVAPVEAQAVPDQPVAWRFRCLGEGLDWLISEKQPRSDWFEVEPLFTRPTPAAADLHQQIMNLPLPTGWDKASALGSFGLTEAEKLAYKIGHRDARHAAAQLVAASPAAAAGQQEQSHSAHLAVNDAGQDLRVDRALSKVRELRNAQGQHGNWNVDQYMQGLYNGIELALATAENRDPVFRSKPAEGWIGWGPKGQK